MRFSNPKNIDLGIVWVAVLPVVLSQRTIYLHNEKVKKVQLLCYYNSLQRLKNKLGTRQLPTAELLLDGSHAYKVSEEWKVQQLDPLQLYLQLVYNANLNILLIHDYSLVTNLHRIKLTALPDSLITFLCI